MHTYTHLQLKKDKASWHMEWGQDKDDFLLVKRRVAAWLDDCHKYYDIEISIESKLERRDGKTMCVHCVYNFFCVQQCLCFYVYAQKNNVCIIFFVFNNVVCTLCV